MKFLLLAVAALTTSCASLQSGDRQVASMSTRQRAQFEMAREYEQAFEAAHAYSIYNDEPRICQFTSGMSRALPAPAKTVVLTFDDGPSGYNTPEVLKILNAYKIKATFFMQGNHAINYPDIVKQVAAEGHIVANHSYSHPIFPQLKVDEQEKEIMNADQVLVPIMANMPIKLFRFPYGSSTCHAINFVVNGAKYEGSLGWHVDTCDWAYQATGTVTSEKALKNCEIKSENISSYQAHVMDQVRKNNGGIILMHETNDNTVSNLEAIIRTLLAEGYRFINMNDPQMLPFIKRTVVPLPTPPATDPSIILPQPEN